MGCGSNGPKKMKSIDYGSNLPPPPWWLWFVNPYVVVFLMFAGQHFR